MVKSILFSTFILFCATIIEASILSNISFLLVVPDLVLICTIYFSLLNGKTIGETTGFISGLFLDFITGMPLGFNCLYRTVICYVTGIFSSTVIITGIFIPIVSPIKSNHSVWDCIVYNLLITYLSVHLT